MAEKLINDVQRLEFDVLHAGDRIAITTGSRENIWAYDFAVDTAENHWPQGTLQETNPDGALTARLPFDLHGCGRYTTKRQNPVQEQMGIAFTPYYDGLIVDSYMWGVPNGSQTRITFNESITQLLHTPFRENEVLQALGSVGGPLSITGLLQAVDISKDYKPTRTEMRDTLGRLIKSGHVSLLRKKVQLFQLTEAS